MPVWLNITLEIAKAVAIVLIPPVGAWIAYQQMQIQRTTLQNALYDRRYKVYEAARRLIGSTLTDGAVDEKEFATYVRDTSDAIFIFDAGIKDYLAKLREHSASLLVFGPMVAQHLDSGGNMLTPDQAKQYIAKKYEAINAINAMYGDLEIRFLPFMTVSHKSAGLLVAKS